MSQAIFPQKYLSFQTAIFFPNNDQNLVLFARRRFFVSSFFSAHMGFAGNHSRVSSVFRPCLALQDALYPRNSKKGRLLEKCRFMKKTHFFSKSLKKDTQTVSKVPCKCQQTIGSHGLKVVQDVAYEYSSIQVRVARFKSLPKKNPHTTSESFGSVHPRSW